MQLGLSQGQDIMPNGGIYPPPGMFGLMSTPGQTPASAFFPAGGNRNMANGNGQFHPMDQLAVLQVGSLDYIEFLLVYGSVLQDLLSVSRLRF